MPDAPVDLRAKAHINRGFAYSQRGQESDADNAIADYTAVIEMPDAGAELRAKAQRLRDRLKAVQAGS
jgi:hypothetical protein